VADQQNPTILKKYTLTVGENTYSSPTAANENDARKLQSLIPSLSGQMEREQPKRLLGSQGSFSSRIAFFHTYKRNSGGSVSYYFFCATQTTLYQWNGTQWGVVPDVGMLADFPVACNINNQMHLSDGTSSWLFDGIHWVMLGLPIPLHAPVFKTATPSASVNITSISRTNGVITVVLASVPYVTAFGTNYQVNPGNYLTLAGVADTSFNATFQIVTRVGNTFTFSQVGNADATSSGGTAVATNFSVLSNRYYWTTFSDQSSTHPHESSSSPRSVGTGAFSNLDVAVLQRPGTASATIGSANVVGVGTDFSQSDVGMIFYTANNTSATIISVTDAQHLTLSGTALAGWNEPVLIVPSRVTHINLYCSASEEDKIGQLLGSYPLSTWESPIIDQSPMIGTTGSYIGQTVRPLLNDPPNATKVMEVSQNRVWMRNEAFQNYFTFTGNEEILAEEAGTPSECVPGIDPNTVSTGQVNETSYPDQSVQITAIRKHGAALFIGTQDNVIPLYGESLADFQLSEEQAFAVGFAGRRACVSTPFGLAFLSYDLKVYLYPSQYSFGVDSTTALVELGRPKRPTFEKIDGTDLQNVHLIFYNWGRRNWLMFSFRDITSAFQTWVFDFEVKGWFQLQTGYTALHVFEYTPGRKSLIAAGTDNQIYVIDDLTGNFPVTGNYPLGTYRELIDFGQPNSVVAGRYIAYEVSDPKMEVDVSFWLDPTDPDNPGTGTLLPSTQTKIGANRFVCRPTAATGATCQRLLVEFAVASNSIGGYFRGFTVKGDEIPDPVL